MGMVHRHMCYCKLSLIPSIRPAKHCHRMAFTSLVFSFSEMNGRYNYKEAHDRDNQVQIVMNSYKINN